MANAPFLRAAATRVLTAAFVLAGLTSCAAGTGTPKTQIYILVDLSETWHNAAQDDRNLKLLQELGHGIAIATDGMEQPMTIQTRVIGTNSLEREPPCSVIYESSFAPVSTTDQERISSEEKLDTYLSDDCPKTLLAPPPEQATEITSALISAANQEAAGAVKRQIVILSDFLEETSAPVQVPDLTGFDVLLIYRPITADYARPEGMAARVDAWKAAIGARTTGNVFAVPDTGLRREIVADLLNRGAKTHD